MPFDQDHKPFFVVLSEVNKGNKGIPLLFRHRTLEHAEDEAQRLANLMGTAFYVMKAKARLTPDVASPTVQQAVTTACALAAGGDPAAKAECASQPEEAV